MKVEKDEDYAYKFYKLLVKIGKHTPDGLCFCQMAIGNPMISDHSTLCKEARKEIKEFEKENGND